MEANTSEYTSSKSTVPAEYDQLGLPELLKLVADLKVRAAKLQEADTRFDVTPVEKKVKPFSGEKEIGIRKWFVDLEKAFAELKLTEDEKLIAVRRLLDGTAAQFLRTIRTVDYADMKRQLVAEFEPDADAAYVRHFQKEAIKRIDLALKNKCPDEELEDYFIASLGGERVTELGSYATSLVELKKLLDRLIIRINDMKAKTEFIHYYLNKNQKMKYTSFVMNQSTPLL